MGKSTDNLQAAFAGESQANRKYLAFGQRADADGFAQVAKLFRAAADAETVHAHNHLRVLGGVKSTAENVEAAVEGEGYEYKSMYPEFLAAAEAEGNQGAAWSFRVALAVEQIHHGLYSQALVAVQRGKDLAAASIWVCHDCGNTMIGEAPEKCPVCGAPRTKFVETK